MAHEIGDETVKLPLGIVALNWLRLYLPLVRAGLPQAPNNRGPEGLGFARQGFRALLGGAAGQLDLRIGATFTGDRAAAVNAAFRDAADTIAKMPATFLTYPNGGDPIFPVDRARRGPVSSTMTIDTTYLRSLGVMHVPSGLWRAFRRFSAWIEPSLTFEWIRLMKAYTARSGHAFDEGAAAAAMTWSDPERDVASARKLALAIMDVDPPLQCVWTGNRLNAGILDMDHCLPWSAWPCGDLWNLLPAHRDVNQRLKREKLPSALTLQDAGPAIRHWWSSAYVAAGQVTRSRFMEEAAASLPTLGLDLKQMTPDGIFVALELQRLRLRQDQRVPEWHRVSHSGL